MTTTQFVIANPELALATLNGAHHDISAAQSIIEIALHESLPIRVGMNSEYKVRFEIRVADHLFVLYGYDLEQPSMAQEWQNAPDVCMAQQRKDEHAPKLFACEREGTVGWCMVDYGAVHTLAEEIGLSDPELTFSEFTLKELVGMCAAQCAKPARLDDQESWNVKDWLNIRHFGSPTMLIVETEQECLQMSFMRWFGGLFVFEHNTRTDVARTYTVSIFEEITVGRPLMLTPLTVTPQGEFERGTPWETAPVVKLKRSHDEFMVMSDIPAEEGVTYTLFDTKTWRAAATARSYSRSELLRACHITLQLAASGEDRIAGMIVSRGLLARTRFLIERFFEGATIEASEVKNLIGALENPNPLGPPEMRRHFPEPFWFVVRFLELLRDELHMHTEG